MSWWAHSLPVDHLHVRGELAEGLIKVVHLHQDANRGDDHENIGGRMRKLVVSSER